MYIGFDDTDSPKGMCTTYLAYKMVNSLKKEKVIFLDFPNLIRFNQLLALLALIIFLFFLFFYLSCLDCCGYFCKK